jgi:hypothetical protein
MRNLRLLVGIILFVMLILALPFFVSQVESSTSTNTYYPSNYSLLGSTQLVSGSLGNLQSDDGSYMTFRSYPNYDFKYGESLGESSWSTNTEYQDKVVLTFTPSVSADYIVLATAEVQGDCISPPDVKARLCIGASAYQELIYRIKDTTDWYPFCALKRVNLPASSQTLKIQYAISSTTLTAKIRNARLYVFSLSSQYAESEGESTSTSTSWQDKVALTFTPSTAGDYLVIATANYGGSSTDFSTLLQFLKDGSVQAGPTRETSATEARYTFGVMRKINLDATSHTFKIQYRTESTLNTARINYAHIIAIRIDQFSNNYYAENEAESAPAAINTVYDKVTNTYTAQAADHLIIGSISYKAGSTSYSVGVKLLQGGAIDQSLLVEHKDSTDYESCFMMAKASLSAGSVTDKIQYYGESTSARVKNARLISLQIPIQQTVEVEFTGSSNTLDWTQLAWAVDSAWTAPSVSVTMQLYNYNLGQYATSGDGYTSYTSSATSNTDETKTQIITMNPTNFRDGSGNWKIKIKGTKSTITQFDFKGDLIKFEATYTSPPVQYYLTVNTEPEGIVAISGEGWYDNSTYVDLTAPQFVPNEAGVGGQRYRFTNWTVDGNFAPGNPIAVYMNVSHTATAHYIIQYNVTFSHTGLDATATGTVVTIDSNSKTYANLPYTMFVDVGTSFTYSYTSIVSSSASGKRFSLTSVTGPGSPFTVSGAVTVKGNYKIQYYLNLTTNPPGIINLSGSGWYDVGTYVPISTPQTIPGGSRYLFLGWVTPDMSEIADPSSLSTTVYLDKPKTVTANYVHQYLVTFTHSGLDSTASGTVVTVNGTPVAYGGPYDLWVNESSVVLYSYETAVSSSVSGKQFRLVSVTGPSSPITVNADITVTGNYQVQYLLTVSSPYGSTGGQGWYNGGSTAYASLGIDSVDHGNGTRHLFTGWNGDASGTNYVQSNPITMSGPKTALARWKTQYYLTVISPYGTPGGANWYNSGDTAYATLDWDNFEHGNGTRHMFTNWNGDASGANYAQSNPITMNGPKTAIARWKTQYYLVVSSPYPPPRGGQGWYDSGSTAYASLGSDTVDYGNGTRRVFTVWSGDASGSNYAQSDPITMNWPRNAIAQWKIQYKLDVTSPYGSPTPASGWFDSGTSITASVISPSAGPSGTRYVCTGWTGTGSVPSSGTGSSVGFSISLPSGITWNWKTQYLLTVLTAPSGLSPQPTRNPLGEAGSTNGWWYDASTNVALIAQSVSGYTFTYWDVDGTSQGNGVNPINVGMNGPHTVTAYYTSITPLSVTISPVETTIYVGQSVTFTSSVSGGTPPYSYQWYLNGNPVSGATSPTWTFNPPEQGIYYVYVVVYGSTAQSLASKLTVIPPTPVGGYAISLAKPTPTYPLAVYAALVFLFGAALSMRKRKRK